MNGVGDGNTAPDAFLVPGRPDQVKLRSERSGPGDGRVYKVTFRGADGRGGFCTGTVQLIVPKNARLVRISGHFVLPAPIELDDATVTITEPLDEVGGVGELTGDILPVTLTAGPGSKRNRGFYRTRPGKQLSMSMEIKTRHHRRGLMEFSIMLDRATMSVGPARCAGGPRPTTRFETSFDLRVGSRRVVVGAILPWQCRGSKLKTL